MYINNKNDINKPKNGIIIKKIKVFFIELSHIKTFQNIININNKIHEVQENLKNNLNFSIKHFFK